MRPPRIVSSQLLGLPVLLNGFEIVGGLRSIIPIESESRHVRMPGDQAFVQSLYEVVVVKRLL
jgi:hypothetical protein